MNVPKQSEFFIAIFASGTGSNAEKIIEHFKQDTRIHMALMVCNKNGAGVLQVAALHQLPVLMIEKERFQNADAYLPELHKFHINFIVLAGFLWKLPGRLVNEYRNRIINIHPALLPKYGGLGMYGAKVHETVIAAGEKESGITIHYVDEKYDNGDIIFQATCAVSKNDTPKSLAEKIHELEHRHYPEIIEECLNRIINAQAI